MKQVKLPKGWTDEKVHGVIDFYANQTPEEAAAEDEAAMVPSETLMSVPPDLVPVIRELIAKRRQSG